MFASNYTNAYIDCHLPYSSHFICKSDLAAKYCAIYCGGLNGEFSQDDSRPTTEYHLRRYWNGALPSGCISLASPILQWSILRAPTPTRRSIISFPLCTAHLQAQPVRWAVTRLGPPWHGQPERMIGWLAHILALFLPLILANSPCGLTHYNNSTIKVNCAS